MDRVPRLRARELEDEEIVPEPFEDDLGFCKNDHSMSFQMPSELADTGRFYGDNEEQKMPPETRIFSHAQSLLTPTKCSPEFDNNSDLKPTRNMHTVIGIPNEYDVFYRSPNVQPVQDRSNPLSIPQYSYPYNSLQAPRRNQNVSSSADGQGEGTLEDQQPSSKGSPAASFVSASKECESDGLHNRKKKQERNRESAKKCRRRKKEYLIKLETEVRMLRDQLATCRNELENVKSSNQKVQVTLKQQMDLNLEQMLLHIKELLNSAKTAEPQQISNILNTFNVMFSKL